MNKKTTNKIIFKEFNKLLNKCKKNGDVPVAAIIVNKNKIIARGFNKRHKNKNVLAHAEINAISKANKRLKKWNLSDCEMYVTLKPCTMCEAVIRQAKIKKIYYLLDKLPNKKEYYKTKFEIINDEEEKNKYKKLLSSFFSDLRK